MLLQSSFFFFFIRFLEEKKQNGYVYELRPVSSMRNFVPPRPSGVLQLMPKTNTNALASTHAGCCAGQPQFNT